MLTETVESILAEANERLGSSEYLVGDSLTYADISFASLLEILSPEDNEQPLTAVALAFNLHMLFKPLFSSKYTNLLPWKSNILKQHLPREVVKACLVPVTMKIEPPPRL